jgi:ATP-dependent Lon protease
MDIQDVKKELSIIDIPDMVLLPGRELVVRVSQKVGNRLFNGTAKDDYFGIALGKQGDDYYTIGSLVKVNSIKNVKGKFELSIDVLERVEVIDFISTEEGMRATYETQPDLDDLDDKSKKEIISYIKELSSELASNFSGADKIQDQIESIEDLTALIAFIMPFVNIATEERQEFLEITSLKQKSLRFIDLFLEHKTTVEFQMELASKMEQDVNKTYREQMLRRQLKAIQEELGEGKDASASGQKDFLSLIENAKMPKDIMKVAHDEFKRLKRQNPGSAEANVIESYLDMLTSLPWRKPRVKPIDIEKAKKMLDQHHYGLDKVKERIIQHLVVMKLKKNKQGSILLLVGPPGTGKTSLGKSIAEVLNREYVRISLGGVRDEAEMRGHRRTYIGAMPGKIIQGMKKVKQRNPVIVLDEVDKLIASANGDPASALLEILDPEQNSTFADHYLSVPFDLSDVFFVATANNLAGIPGPLRDRMEIIDISSYTNYEKFNIGKRHLMSAVLEEHGLKESQLQVSEEAMKEIIENYTREAGVRQLKRQLATVARVSAEKILTGLVDLPYVIEADHLEKILGHELRHHDKVSAFNPPGVVTGMAWTPVGGDILFIEGAMMAGKGQMVLTGQLGDVMKESARIAQSLIRSRLSINLEGIEFDQYDTHIHVPAGAIPKDGPSAGVAMVTAMASLVLGKPVDSQLSMTGEISLRGAVLPVGGIKEKVLAAHRAGIKRVIIPRENQKNIEDIPKDVREELIFVLVETVEDVFKETLGVTLPKPVVFERVFKEDGSVIRS